MVIIWTPSIIYDIYHLNLTMSSQQMEKSAIYYVSLITVPLAPTAGAPFYPKCHTFTYSFII